MFQRIFQNNKNNRNANRVARRRAFCRGLRYENLEKRDLMTGDLGANFFAQATLLSTDNDRGIEEQVGGSDPNDYFKFNLTRQSVVDIDMTNLSQDIDLKLYDANSNQLGSSTAGGSASESIERTLPAGTYIVQAYAFNNANSTYRLSIDINQVGPTDNAGNSMSNARNIGTLNGAMTFSDFVSTSGDRDDYYRFNVTESKRLAIGLSGLSNDADVQLLNSAGQVLASGTNGGSSSESITRELTAGTYFVRVYAFDGETNYNLTLNAQSLTSPPDRVTVQTQPLSSSSVRLTWNDASNEDSYRIFRWSGSSELQVGTANQNGTNFTATGLEAGSRHWFYVRSQNSEGSTSSFWVFADTPAANWANDPQVVSARAQLAGLSSYGASIYRQLDVVPLQNTSGNRSHDSYARAIEQFNVEDTSRSTNISNRYTRGGYNNWDTRCNIFAGDVMRAMNAPLRENRPATRCSVTPTA